MDPDPNKKQPQESELSSTDVGLLMKAIEEKEAKLLEMEKKRRAGVLSTAVVVLAGTLVGVFVTIFASISSSDGRRTVVDSELQPGDLKELEAEIQRIQSSLEKPQVLSRNNPDFTTAKIAKDIELLNNRLNSLSTAILASPERAIAIPLLRRDIDGISKRIEEHRIQGKSEIDRLYEQQKWMLTGIGTVLLGVAGGAISLIMRSLPKGDSESA
jgi:hypothetical protein